MAMMITLSTIDVFIVDFDHLGDQPGVDSDHLPPPARSASARVWSSCQQQSDAWVETGEKSFDRTYLIFRWVFVVSGSFQVVPWCQRECWVKILLVIRHCWISITTCEQKSHEGKRGFRWTCQFFGFSTPLHHCHPPPNQNYHSDASRGHRICSSLCGAKSLRELHKLGQISVTASFSKTRLESLILSYFLITGYGLWVTDVGIQTPKYAHIVAN